MTLQHYHEDGSTTLFTDSPLFDEPKIIKHDEYENWVIDAIVREAEQYREPPAHEFAQIFPECKKIYTARLKEIKQELLTLQAEEQEMNGKRASFEIKPDLADFHLAGIEARREMLLEEKNKYDTILMFTGTKKRKAAQDFAISLQRAKEYPIENLIKIQRNKAQCLWHDDRDPSMHYYRKDNRVYCFVCNQGWDALDVVQKLHDCDLKEAVAIINNET